MTEEQTVLDDHEDKVEDLMERQEDLVVTTGPVMHDEFSLGDHRPVVGLITNAEHLSQRLSQVHSSLMKVKRVVEDKELDMCLLEEHEESLKSIDTDLHGIKRDMLLIDDDESLAGKAPGLEKASFALCVAIKCLVKNIKAESAVSKETELNGVKLPKVSVFTFAKKVLNWKSF